MTKNTTVTAHIIKHGAHGIHTVRVKDSEHINAVLITRHNIHRYIVGRYVIAKIVRVDGNRMDLIPVDLDRQ